MVYVHGYRYIYVHMMCYIHMYIYICVHVYGHKFHKHMCTLVVEYVMGCVDRTVWEGVLRVVYDLIGLSNT